MPNNRINIDLIRTMMRHTVDMAVHSSIERFRADLGDKERLAHRIAHTAAEAAVETLAAHFNQQLRLIEIDQEQRLEELSRRQLQPIIFDPDCRKNNFDHLDPGTLQEFYKYQSGNKNEK